jgi:uncharacterized protein (TIGR03086 family)
VVPLASGVGLLESAVSYALASAGQATPQQLPLATPCTDWDLRMLLHHVSDSLDVLSETIRTGCAGLDPPPDDDGPGLDPVSALRHRASTLLATCAAAEPPDRLVAIADRELTTGVVATAGALEIAVHGWDISVACGACQPVPAVLAAALLPIAPLLITPGTRPGLFGDPVPVSRLACPGDQLTAFLGRQPSPLAPPATA